MDKPLLWHQGLFLQPQHLQLKDKHDLSQFTPYYHHFKPYLKGVVRIDLNEKGLLNYMMSVHGGEFWFPDMTYAVLGENAILEARDFRELFPADGGSMMVYVGLKAWMDDRPNVTEISETSTDIRSVTTRFAVVREEKDVRDLHLGEARAQVKRMVHVLRLFFGSEVSHAPNYHILPVARVERKGENLHLSSEYVPPCVDINASGTLSELIRSMVDTVIGSAMGFGAYKRSRGIHHAELGSKDMVHLMVLSTINRYVPYFHALISEQKTVHPHEVYDAIRRFTGELSTFSTEVSVLGNLEHESRSGAKTRIPEGQEEGAALVVSLKPYNHEDLWACFSSAVKLVEHLIKEITTGPDHVLDIVFSDPYYSCAMDEAHFKNGYTYYLVMKTDMDHQDVVNAVDTNIKITAPSLMTTLVERSLPGIPVKHLPTPPQGLPRRTNGIYFRIDNSREEFKNIRQEGRLSLFWYEPPDDLEMELMMVKDQ